MENDTYIGELNQLRESQIAVVDQIDRIRDSYHGQIPADLERIQNDALKIIHDIDEIRERRNDELQSRPFRPQPVRPATKIPAAAASFFDVRL